MITSTISPKYQIVIPSDIRAELEFKLEPGQKLEVTAHKRHIELHPILSPDQIIGFLKGPDSLKFERDADRNF